MPAQIAPAHMAAALRRVADLYVRDITQPPSGQPQTRAQIDIFGVEVKPLVEPANLAKSSGTNQ